MNYEALLRSEGMPPELPLLVDQALIRLDAEPVPSYEAHERKLVGIPKLEQHTAVDVFFEKGEYEHESSRVRGFELEDPNQTEESYYGGSEEVRGILAEAANSSHH